MQLELNLLLFGVAAEMLGARSLSFKVEQGSTVGDLKAALFSQYPSLSDLSDVKFALNESYVSDGAEINAGDEVAIIPPVSGG